MTESIKQRGDKAVAYFLDGYNCAQAVFMSFAEDMGISVEEAAKLASPFGGGIGGMRETCGALTGSFMALGLLKGFSDTGKNGVKPALYEKVKGLAEKFKEEETSTICREILVARANGAAPHTPESPCTYCVRIAAQNLEMLIND